MKRRKNSVKNILIPHNEELTSTVINCYEAIHAFIGDEITDLTEGKYLNDSNTRSAYEDAQKRQAEYLLDEINCRRGSHILDIGCGYGRILKYASERGAKAIGITLSPPQVKYCRNLGHTVYKMNYKDIPNNWNGKFHGIVANGSIEHFVHHSDYAAGKENDVYQEMFKISHRILRRGGKFVTTTIHLRKRLNYKQLLKGPKAQKKGSLESRLWQISESFGGSYPYPNQLEKCAKKYFKLENEEDGTHDYYLTSEYWLKTLKKNLLYNPVVWKKILSEFVKHPDSSKKMFETLFVDQSWNWQFRGSNPPLKLLRQTWKRID